MRLAPSSRRDWLLAAARIAAALAAVVAFVTHVADWARLRRVVGAFRASGRLASEGLAAPRALPGIDYSDHAEFWRHGYPGILITDAPIYRNEHYHRSSDLPDSLDFDRLTLLTEGLVATIATLGRER